MKLVVLNLSSFRGVWVVAKTLVEFEADITCAAGPHPSVQLEQGVYGGKLPNIFVDVPIETEAQSRFDGVC